MPRLKNEAYKALNGIEFKIGSHSYDTDTAIFNMGCATTCPSLYLGLCKVGHCKCYAMKPERGCWKSVKPYRVRQGRQGRRCSVEDFVGALKTMREKWDVKYFRYNEASDFRTQADVDKLSEIARQAKEFGMVVFGYTARVDLDFTGVNFIVRFSGHVKPNQGKGSTYVVKNEAEALKIVKALGTKRHHICGLGGTTQKCGKCKVCTVAIDMTICFIEH